MDKQRITLDDFIPVYEEWKSSNLNVKEFCRDIGFRENRFYYWKKKLKHESRETMSHGKLIPVKMSNGRMELAAI